MGRGGVRLWYWTQTVASAAGTCLVVHGLGEHSGRYHHVAEALNRHRWNVWALDYRGHGRSEGRRGHCGSLHELLDDVGTVITHLKAQPAATPLVLLGHSLGGLIVLTYALECPNDLHAVVASSPALDLATPPPWLKRWVAEVLGPRWPTLAVHNGVHPAWLSHDPASVAAYRRDPLIHDRVTLGGYLAVREAMRWALTHAGQMRAPCLILQAGDDRIVSAAASRRFAEAVGSPGSQYREYPGWFHELFNEVGREDAVGDLTHWLAARHN